MRQAQGFFRVMGHIGAIGKKRRPITHSPKTIPDTGSFEVRFPGGREFFYWDDDKSRGFVTGKPSSAEALEEAKLFARNEKARYGRSYRQEDS